jgi:drug/metabolite transporter (DMT)-like permease
VKRQRSALAGIAFALIAVACFAVLDTTTKFVSASVPLLMALWFRYFFQAASTTVIMLPMHGRALLRTGHPRFHVVRGLLLLCSSLFAFFSLRAMPVGEFTAIVMITPLAVTVLAAVWLKERVSPLRWLLVVGGFVGTLIIIRPGGQSYGWSAFLPLGLVASNASFQVLTSKMARTEQAATMHFYTGWVGALVAAVALPFVWVTLHDWHLWALLILMGTAATIGHFLLILAYGNAPATTLTPYLYMQIAFAMLFGWIVFAHLPDRWSVLGIALIAVCGAGGAWLTARERRPAAGL